MAGHCQVSTPGGTHFFRVHLPPPPVSTCTINLLPPAWLPSLQPQVSLYPVQPNLPSFPHQNHFCNCESESLAIAVDAANSAAATSTPSGDKDTPTVDTTTTATDTTATYYGDTTTSSDAVSYTHLTLPTILLV